MALGGLKKLSKFKQPNFVLFDSERRLTQHKRFVLYSTYPNFCFAKTSFMLKPLDELVFL